MNKDYLNKVVDILVSETTINSDPGWPTGEVVSAPFSSFPLHNFGCYLSSPTYFIEFVIDYYGLTEEETEYVWKQYRDIINNKI